jgi:hypothetical protein
MYTVRAVDGTYGYMLTLKVDEEPQHVVVPVPVLVQHCKGESMFN